MYDDHRHVKEIIINGKRLIVPDACRYSSSWYYSETENKFKYIDILSGKWRSI